MPGVLWMPECCANSPCEVQIRWGEVNLAAAVVQGGEDYAGLCDGEQQTALAGRELMPDTLLEALEFPIRKIQP